MQGSPAYAAPSDLRRDFDSGVNAILRSVKSGHMSDEQGVNLIKALTAAYYGALISRDVSDYLDYGIADFLDYAIRNWDAVGVRE